MQDYDIIKQCLDGNTNAFEELVERYQRLVYSMSLKYLKDTSLAEDTSQEVFIKAYTRLRSYNPEFKFSTWLSKITYNTCIDQMRRGKDKEVIHIQEDFEVEDSDYSPEETVIVKERKRKLEALISGLEQKYKEPLMLFHTSGLRYEEISKLLKVPITIVKNRIFRARKMLKEALKEF